MTLYEAFHAGDAAWIAGWISGRMMVDVPHDVVAGWIKLFVEDYFGGRSDGWIDLFLRVRMSQGGWFRAGRKGTGVDRLTCDLHVMFLSLEETEEHLCNLRRRERGNSGAPKLATPGIERTEVKVVGVDATARRVAPTDHPS